MKLNHILFAAFISVIFFSKHIATLSEPERPIFQIITVPNAESKECLQIEHDFRNVVPNEDMLLVEREKIKVPFFSPSVPLVGRSELVKNCVDATLSQAETEGTNQSHNICINLDSIIMKDEILDFDELHFRTWLINTYLRCDPYYLNVKKIFFFSTDIRSFQSIFARVSDGLVRFPTTEILCDLIVKNKIETGNLLKYTNRYLANKSEENKNILKQEIQNINNRLHTPPSKILNITTTGIITALSCLLLYLYLYYPRAA